MLRKYFLSKWFVPLIKGSVSPQFKAIFGKLNFWRNIDRRGPYINGENLNYLKLCLENIFCQNYLFHSSKEVFLHNFRPFFENWIFEGILTGADLTKMVKIWTIFNYAQKIFFVKTQFKIVQIFTIFVRSAPVDNPSKIQFSKNGLKLWRNTSFDEWNK